MTTVVGFFASAMIAVLIAKIVGHFQACPVDAETGAPCNWFMYAVCGGLLGMLGLPTVVIMRMRRARAASRTSGKRASSGSR
jgi:hypothetical protein